MAKKKPTSKVIPNGKKRPKNIENPESFYAETPKWVFRNMDINHERWSLKSCDEIYSYVIEKLKDFEGQTWGEIIKASGGRNKGTNSHFESINGFIKEARDRWIELKLEEYPEAFSLRLTGTHRPYGILENGTFRIIWFDENHEIYKSNKKHT